MGDSKGPNRRMAALAQTALSVLLALLLASPLAACSPAVAPDAGQPSGQAQPAFDLSQVPSYTGSPYTVIADGEPDLTEADAEGATESYAPLDDLGRCGAALAVVSPETMPTGEREFIGMIHPSGWHTVRYEGLVDGDSLYNRCHLIARMLTAEDANERNLITGTRYLNTEGMLPFEEQVADYVHETGGRVLYRSEPVFAGDELVARGVHLEALSLGDGGRGVRFNVFCYNVQPGIGIDYATGDSWLERDAVAPEGDADPGVLATYVLNASSMRFHEPDCPSVGQISERNRREFTGSREELIERGYEPCGECSP